MADFDIRRVMELEKQLESLPLPDPVKLALFYLTVAIICLHFGIYIYRKWPKLFATLATPPGTGKGVNAEDVFRELEKMQSILRLSSEAVPTNSPVSSAPPSPAAGVLSPRGTVS